MRTHPLPHGIAGTPPPPAVTDYRQGAAIAAFQDIGSLSPDRNFTQVISR
jgi:hypothetical protein